MAKQLFIAGNWKSNKTLAEAKAWLETFTVPPTDAKIVLCAPFTLLNFLNWAIAQQKLPLELAAQDVSPFAAGAYTGEVNAAQVKELAQWVIIGHSERRKHFGETDEVLAQKVTRAHEAGLKVIYCVPDDSTSVPQSVAVVAYEPVWAIGSGKAESPQNAARVISTIKDMTGAATGIYGGSVTPGNVMSFVQEAAIDGVLPG